MKKVAATTAKPMNADSASLVNCCTSGFEAASAIDGTASTKAVNELITANLLIVFINETLWWRHR